jgi:hypothetical protein
MRLFWLVVAAFLAQSAHVAEGAGFFENAWREGNNCALHGGCDVIWSANRALDDGIRSKAESLTGPLKTLYEQVMADFVNNKWPALLSGLDVSIRNDVNLIDSKVTELLNRVEAISDHVIDHLQDGAQKLIADVSDDANRLIVRMSTEARTILDDEVNCKIVHGALAEAEADIQSWFSHFHWTTTCEGEHGGNPSQNDYTNMTLIAWCDVKRSITLKSNVLEIYRKYAELSDKTTKMRCATLDKDKEIILTGYLLQIRAEMTMWSDAAGNGL